MCAGIRAFQSLHMDVDWGKHTQALSHPAAVGGGGGGRGAASSNAALVGPAPLAQSTASMDGSALLAAVGAQGLDVTASQHSLTRRCVPVLCACVSIARVYAGVRACVCVWVNHRLVLCAGVALSQCKHERVVQVHH